LINQLLEWYGQNKRELPWRETSDPYRIWVSEIILQQTQIKTGIKYYNKFITAFPNIKSLSSAKEIEVLKIWEGLGYYKRALNMLHTAKAIVRDYNNVFPVEYNELIKLKGIGAYTAAAISSICYNEKRAVVDGNVYRVLSRFYNIKTPINTHIGQKKFQKIADKLIPDQNPGTYNQAIMDFGSTHCKKNNPKCNICPLKNNCKGFKLNNICNLPVKKFSKKLKTRHFNYFFITDDEYFIIEQRGINDIWSKLYQLPLIESEIPMNRKLVGQNSCLEQFNILDVQHDYNTIHILSHQKLIISFWQVKTNRLELITTGIRIKKIDMKKYPFPKPLQKYFDKAHLNY
jgi:A/G-specific adenine glycosylase